MTVAVDVEGDPILFRVADFDDVDSLEVDDLGTDILYGCLPFFNDKAKNIVNFDFEAFQELFCFGCTLRLRFPLAYNLPSLFAAVDGDRLLIDDAELASFHVGELDVVGKNIRTGQIAVRE